MLPHDPILLVKDIRHHHGAIIMAPYCLFINKLNTAVKAMQNSKKRLQKKMQMKPTERRKNANEPRETAV